ncbi:MAG: DNA translocase FtsK [Bacteroidales bacterium]|nr:DNA translocase FtsK [Bacteroidales bacterium]
MNLFPKSWDEEKREAAKRITGFCLAIITLFFLIASFSYLFTWKQDMSLMDSQSMMTGSKAVHNAAGKLGYLFSYFFIGKLFGLGSLLMLLIPAALSLRLLAGKWNPSLLKTTVLSIAGAFVAGMGLSFIGKAFRLEHSFGWGLGGQCGAVCTGWFTNLAGTIICIALIVLMAGALLFFCSDRFNSWLASIGKHAEASEEQEERENRKELREQRRQARREARAAAAAEKAARKAEEAVEAEEEPVPIAAEPEPEPIPVRTAEKPAAEAAEGSFEIVKSDDLEKEVKEPLKPIDNRMDPPDGLPKYKFPSLDLLENYKSDNRDVTNEELNRNNNRIRTALANYKIQISDVKAIVGPTVTLYKVYPAPGVRIADIKKLQDDIAMSLSAKGVRVIALADSVGIEVANDHAVTVPLKQMLNDDAYRKTKAELPVAIGYTITQKVKVFDLADAPHLLIAGATKQGKSVGLNVLVASLLYSKHPSELKFVFIDPKMVEFSSYGSLLHHYLAVMPQNSEKEEVDKAIVKSPKDAEKVLRSLCTEMDQRYSLLSQAGVNKISLYNEKYKEHHLRPDQGHRFLPYLVVVVDEFADLTMSAGGSQESRAASRSIVNSIIRLAQKGRAAGLHVILATQRPSVDVISGQIKANFPLRIAFRVAARVDSMTILDAPGAEKLIGRGDMLLSAGIDSERLQCAFISGEETDRITSFIEEQSGYGRSYNTPYYLPDVSEGSGEAGGASIDMRELDERFEEAAKLIVTTQRGSTSDLQRKLGMGYAKAGRVMDQLEAAGIVGPQDGSKPRQVLVADLESLQTILDAYRH